MKLVADWTCTSQYNLKLNNEPSTEQLGLWSLFKVVVEFSLENFTMKALT